MNAIPAVQVSQHQLGVEGDSKTNAATAWLFQCRHQAKTARMGEGDTGALSIGKIEPPNW